MVKRTMTLSPYQFPKLDRINHVSTNPKTKIFSLILTKILSIRKLKNEPTQQLFLAIKIESQI